MVFHMVRVLVEVNMLEKWQVSATASVTVLCCPLIVPYISSTVDGNDTKSWLGLCKSYLMVDFSVQEIQAGIFVAESISYFDTCSRLRKLSEMWWEYSQGCADAQLGP